MPLLLLSCFRCSGATAVAVAVLLLLLLLLLFSRCRCSAAAAAVAALLLLHLHISDLATRCVCLTNGKIAAVSQLNGLRSPINGLRSSPTAAGFSTVSDQTGVYVSPATIEVVTVPTSTPL